MVDGDSLKINKLIYDYIYAHIHHIRGKLITSFIAPHVFVEIQHQQIFLEKRVGSGNQ